MRPPAADAVERLPVQPRHLQIADHEIERLRLHLVQRFLAVRRVFDDVTRVLQRVQDRCRQRRFVLDDEDRRSGELFGLLVEAAARVAAPAWPCSFAPVTGSST